MKKYAVDIPTFLAYSYRYDAAGVQSVGTCEFFPEKMTMSLQMVLEQRPKRRKSCIGCGGLVEFAGLFTCGLKCAQSLKSWDGGDQYLPAPSDSAQCRAARKNFSRGRK